ncbi:GNAT family N-acetyltransferase [Austwickia sp. TVS 96-490-7B]|uniref:GNAT family N-acetyltransferase n=1 Tax=Austwickia sp. TVS 96-490-7B TaxID=2830843 RepID=UPI002106B91E|nr:GNAT family protein [Austwickia sp. TVS 96-490-7B]
MLRALTTRDRRAWEALRAANADWLRPWEASSPLPTRRMSFSQLVRHLDREGRAGRAQPFVIEYDGRLIGQMHLSQMLWGASRSARAGYWIDHQMAGQGIAPTALAAAVDHAFVGLGLHRVAVDVRVDNAPSVRMVRKLGFRDEGIRRAALYVDGQWRDHHEFALTVEDLDGESLVHRWNLRAALER